jgi:phosphoribosylformimino-5-aminoimidazole carboxamide ribotide isomerase
MIIYPAIDLQNGKVVRLTKGDLTAPTVYGDDPAAQAQVFENLGFQWLHVVDLDGARDGSPSDASVVRSILKSVAMPVQLGGGIRTRAHIDHGMPAG